MTADTAAASSADNDAAAATAVRRDDWMLAPPVRAAVDHPADPREEAGAVEKFKVLGHLYLPAPPRAIPRQ